MSHERNISPRALVASARQTLRHLPTTNPRLRLDQPQCAEAEAPICLVLLHDVSGLLVALGEGAAGHG